MSPPRPGFCGCAGALWPSLAYRGLTPVSAFVFTQCCLCPSLNFPFL